VSEVPGRLTGHVSVITGAGQGIGRGIALAMAKEGASVALAGRTLRKVQDVAGEIAELGGRALAVECDVSCRKHVDEAVAGDQTFGAYAMAKEAIRGLSRVAAREWGPYGIRVNVVVPTALSPSAAEYMAANRDATVRSE